jgi:nitroimidazol reductase NimA-like FMN-containing flavoprotein (pyridoxamine 5'-phosphate oxidase superfamily)
VIHDQSRKPPEDFFAETDGAIVELGREAIDALLKARLVGRIGCHLDGRTYVVPVVYAYDGGSLYACSGEGRKIEMMRANPNVCFEVDEYDEAGNGSWRSVIAEGVFEELKGLAATRALALVAKRFVARTGRRGRPRRGKSGGKIVVFRIRVERASGRAVAR